MWGFLKIFNRRVKQTNSLTEKRILVVDDGEVERKFISHTLQKLDCRVATFGDGESALADIAQNTYDLVILDFYLPKIRGKEICRKIKAEPRTRDIPVIFLTGSASPSDLIDCYEVGAEYYLSKPISGDQLVKQVRMIFQDLEEESRWKKRRS